MLDNNVAFKKILSGVTTDFSIVNLKNIGF